MKKKSCTINCAPDCASNPANHIPHEHLMVGVAAFILALVGVIGTNNLAEAAPLTKKQNTTPTFSRSKTSCKDTDPANIPVIAGSVSATTLDNRGRAITKKDADSCLNLIAVKETYCTKNGQLSNKVSLCAAGQLCRNGACIAATTVMKAPIIASKPTTTPFNTITSTAPSLITTTTPVTNSTSSPASSAQVKRPTAAVTIEADTSFDSSSTRLQTILAGTTLGRFKIINNTHFTITIHQLLLTDYGNHTGSEATYRLYYSDENSPNYNENTAVTEQNNITFNNLSIPINGGSYRYITVSLASANGLSSGDTFQLGIGSTGDVLFSTTEADLGYDGNLNGTLSDTISGLVVTGNPTLSTLVKK